MPLDYLLERAYFHDHITGEQMRGLPDPSPCPFCGPHDRGGIMSVMGKYETAVYQAICDSCGATGPAGNTAQEAAAAWNNRAYYGATSRVARMSAMWVSIVVVGIGFRINDLAQMSGWM